MKYSGNAGFRLKDVEVEPDVYEPQLVVKRVRGNVISSRYRRDQNGDKSTIDNIRITNQISLVADQFFMKHISNLLYMEYQGVKWKVESFDVSRAPRVIVDLGGVYNEQENSYPRHSDESNSEV
jgi:hypothetical protein